MHLPPSRGLARSRKSGRWLPLAISALLAGLSASGCLLDEGLCTPGDTSYGCCLKQHPANPELCGATEKEAAEVLRQTASSGLNAPSREAAAAVGTAIAAVTLSSDDNPAPLQKLLADVEQILRQCAIEADELVNQKHFGGSPSPKQCAEVVRVDDKGNPVSRAMELGIEKHTIALQCAKARLRKLIPGRFSLEQRYRYDREMGKKQLVNQGKRGSLTGTLKPDVIIHTGDPLKVQAVFDFKFPCLSSKPATWRVYESGPYRDSTQGEIYGEAFGVTPVRITPWEIIR